MMLQNRRMPSSKGRGFVTHAMVWANILGSAADSAKTPVNVMASQLKDVEAQLKVLLSLLQTQLAGLQAHLEVNEDYLSKLQAALWSAIAAMLLCRFLYYTQELVRCLVLTLSLLNSNRCSRHRRCNHEPVGLRGGWRSSRRRYCSCLCTVYEDR